MSAGDLNLDLKGSPTLSNARPAAQRRAERVSSFVSAQKWRKWLETTHFGRARTRIQWAGGALWVQSKAPADTLECTSVFLFILFRIDVFGFHCRILDSHMMPSIKFQMDHWNFLHPPNWDSAGQYRNRRVILYNENYQYWLGCGHNWYCQF